jgi:hypothetical protein
MIAGRLVAHHSAAMFDHDKLVTLHGTVEKFEWTSPHVWLWIVVSGDDGQSVSWGLEANDTGGMSRIGWSKRSVSSGDKVSVTLNPRLDGKPAGFLKSLTLPDGTVLNAGAGGGPQKFVDPSVAGTAR